MQKLSLVFKKISFWNLAILIIAISLVPKLPLINIKGTFVAIRIEDYLIAFALLIWGLSLICSKQLQTLLKDKLNRTLALFFFVSFVSLFSGIFLTHTVELNIGLLHYLRRVELMLLMPFAIYTVQSKKQIKTILLILVGIVVIVDLYAFGQQYLHWSVISTTNSELSKGTILTLTPGARVNSTFAGHYDLAVFLVMVLTLATAMFFFAKNIIHKIGIFILSMVSFVVLIMTAARLSFIAVLVGVICSLILSGRKMLVFLAIFAAILVFAYPSQLRERFVSTITINLLGQGQRYSNDQNTEGQLNIATLPIGESTPSGSESASKSAGLAADIVPGEPIDTTELGVYRSFEIRLRVEWPRAVRAFIKNPILGTGYSSIGLATDNDFLRSLGEVGLLGTAALILVLIEVLKRVWNNIRAGGKFMKFFSVGVFSIIVAFILNALFIDVFEASKIASLFWIIIGVNLAGGKSFENS